VQGICWQPEKRLASQEGLPPSTNLLWVQSSLKISSHPSEASSSSSSQEIPRIPYKQMFITVTKQTVTSHLVAWMRENFWSRKYMAKGRDFLVCRFNVILNFLSECTNAEPLVKPVHVQTVLKHYKTEILAHVHLPYVTCAALRSHQYGAPRTVSCHVAFVSFSCVSRSRKNIERYLWTHEGGKLKDKTVPAHTMNA